MLGVQMTLQAVHHTGLVVSDLDRSIDFYHDVLGLEFYNEPTPWFSGPELATGVGVPGAELRQVTFWVGPNSTVELLEYRNPPQVETRPIRTASWGRHTSASRSRTCGRPRLSWRGRA